jgi:hypothetical protein
MVVASFLALTFAVSIYFFLPLHPSDVGIKIEEEVAHNDYLIPKR